MTTQDSNLTLPRIVDRRQLHAAAVNEHQARAAAGITMALGAVAFVYANFAKVFWPIRTVSALFVVDFLIRVTARLERSPSGLVAGWMTRRQTPQWVSAKPKRFAWTLGLAMALVMTIITNSGIHGPLPRTICLICLTLMWLEAVLGLCLGCELYAFMVRRGWRAADDAFEVCASGACDLDEVVARWGTAATARSRTSRLSMIKAANIAAAAHFVVGCVGFYSPDLYVGSVTLFLAGSILFLAAAVASAVVDRRDVV